MKKLIAFILAAVMCLSLVACGGEKDPVAEKEEMIVGEWLFDNGATIIFNEDHTGKMTTYDTNEEIDIRWTYNEDLDYFVWMRGNTEIRIDYKIEDGVMTITTSGFVGTKQ